MRDRQELPRLSVRRRPESNVHHVLNGAISEETVESDDSSVDLREDMERGTTRPGRLPGNGGIFEFPGSIRTALSSLNLTIDRFYES